jgi:DNA-binding LytR/AlgR family response regulator
MYRIRLIDRIDSITFLTGEANYTRIHFLRDKDLILCKTLSQCVAQLPGFLRIHKQYAINPRFLTGIVTTGPRTAHTLVAGNRLPISRRRLREVLAAVLSSDVVNTA